MLNPFICGTFRPEEEDEPYSPLLTPRKSRRGSSCRNHNKNPFSAGGLDKFSALLADLEEKKKKIYSQMGSQDISFVRFVYSNSNDCVPVVVKLKVKKHEDKTRAGQIKDEHATNNSEALDKSPMESMAAVQVVKQPVLESDEKNKKKSCRWNMMKLDRWRRPSYYLAAVIILILLLLMVFGRSAAILCASLVWYIFPTLKGGDSDFKKPTKTTKVYIRRLSTENKIVRNGSSSPEGNNSGTVKDMSPRQHGHRKGC